MSASWQIQLRGRCDDLCLARDNTTGKTGKTGKHGLLIGRGTEFQPLCKRSLIHTLFPLSSLLSPLSLSYSYVQSSTALMLYEYKLMDGRGDWARCHVCCFSIFEISDDEVDLGD